ncbi:MAG: CCA tRNA nucleotidyltransferase [Ferroplasma sp.]
MDYIEKLLINYLPDDAERAKLSHIADDVLEAIRDICRTEKINAKAVEVGSVSKHTNLKCSDIDIFITFSREYSTEFIEKKGLEIGHRILKNGFEKYAEHPYVSGTIDSVKIDIVPAYMIEEGQHIISTVDRTPLHTKYVNEHADKDKLHDILLLKAFMKSINVYGSEIFTSGFSGYLCEVLIIHYNSFNGFIKHMSGLKGKLIVPENYDDASRYREPVIIIDPVDSTRNAGAAVSEENLSKLKLACKIYLAGDYSLLTGNGKIAINRKNNIKIFLMPKPDIIDDIIYPQAVRFKNKIWNIFKNFDFLPISSEIYMGKEIQILIEYERESMPAIKIHQGPPVYSNEAIKFINIWNNDNRLMRGPYIIGDRVYADVKNIDEKFDDIFWREILKIDIGKNLDNHIKDLKIINYEEGMKMEVIDKFYSKYLFSK